MRRRTRNSPDVEIALPQGDINVLQVCHPDWRGVRSSALAFRDPVLESADLAELIPHLQELQSRGAHTVVIQGWPPNARAFAEAASAAGIDVSAVFHSSPAQHGVDGGESEAVSEVLALAEQGSIKRVGTVKAGLVDAYRSIGHQIVHVPNRPPEIPTVQPIAVPAGINAGVFLFPMWRKNVTTQILACMENGWRPFVMHDPGVPYLPDGAFVVTGELDADEALRTQAAMNVTLNVTLSECHPMMPMEAYRLGVPCLTSTTSDLFTDDPELAGLTTVAEADNPSAIAQAAVRLLDNKDHAVVLANQSLDRLDQRAKEKWAAFTGR